jgi:DNA-directed RNA polymerase subunit RPC12/RpoP
MKCEDCGKSANKQYLTGHKSLCKDCEKQVLNKMKRSFEVMSDYTYFKRFNAATAKAHLPSAIEVSVSWTTIAGLLDSSSLRPYIKELIAKEVMEQLESGKDMRPLRERED